MAGGNVIGSAFVGIKPDLSGFQQELRQGVSQALQGLRLVGGQALQLDLPGLENKASQLIRSGVQRGLTEGTQLAIPLMTSNVRSAMNESVRFEQQALGGILEGTLRNVQKSFDFTPQVQHSLTAGTQLALPLMEQGLISRLGGVARSWGSSLVGVARDWGSSLVTHTVTAAGGAATALFSAFRRGSETEGPGIGRALVAGLNGAINSGAGAIGAALQTAVVGPARSAGTLAGIALTAGLGAALEAGLVAGAQLDKLRQSFIALTGSASTAQEIIASLRQTTIKTGQDFGLLAQSAQQLITAGFNPKIAETVINSVAQMVTVYGRGMQGFQRASIQLEEIGFRGTVQAQQLNALIRDGVPAYAALTQAAVRLGLAQAGSADATAKAKDAMKDGKITAEAFFAALSDPAVIGSVTATMNAIQTNVAFQLGQLRTISIHILAQIAEPIQKVFGQALRPVTDQLDLIATRSDLLAAAGERMAHALGPIVPLFQRLANAIAKVVATAQSAGGLDKLTNQIKPLLPLLGPLAGGLGALGLSFGSSIPLLGAFIPAISPLVGIFAGLIAVTPGIQGQLLLIVKSLEPLGRAVAGLLLSVASVLGPFLTEVVQAVGPLVSILGISLAKALTSLSPTLQQLGPILHTVSLAVLQMALALDPLVPILVRLAADLFVQLLRDLLPMVGPLTQIASVIVMALAPGLLLVLQTIEPLIPLIAALIIGIKAWTLAQTILDFALAANPIGAVTLTIEALIAGIVLLVANWDLVRATVIQVSVQLQDFIRQNQLLAGAIEFLGGPIAGLVSSLSFLIVHWSEVQTAGNQTWTLLSNFGAWLTSTFIVTWATVSASVSGFFSWLGTTIGGFFSWLGTTVSAAWSAFAAQPAFWIGFVLAFVAVKLFQLVDLFAVWVAGMILKLFQLQDAFAVWAAGMIVAAFAWGQSMYAQAINAASSFVLAIGREWLALPGQVAGWLARVIPAIVGWIPGVVQAALQGAQALGRAWNDEINKLPGEAVSVGVNMVQGIINGIKSQAASGAGAIGDFVRGLIEGAHRAGDGGSPYRRFAREVGVPIVQGIVMGLGWEQPNALGAMNDLVGSLSGLRLAAAPGGGVIPAGGPGSSPLSVHVNVSNAGASADEIVQELAWALAHRGAV